MKHAHTMLRLALALIVVVTTCMWLTGCRDGDKAGNRVIASVYGHRLMDSDIADLVPDGITGNDSVEIVTHYIDQWIDQMVMIAKAERNVKQDFTKQIEQYHHSLLVYAYEQQIVEQNIDTTVSNAEIEAYYNEHPDDFVLVSPIAKVIYFTLPAEVKATTRTKVTQMMQSATITDEDLVRLQQTIHGIATDAMLSYDQWIPLTELHDKMPTSSIADPLYFRNRRYSAKSDSNGTTMIHVFDYKLTNEQSPIEIERDNIRTIILNHRKVAFLHKMRQDLRREAEQEGKIEWEGML